MMTGATFATLCPYCRSPIESRRRTIACPSCGTLHHRQCWRNHGTCSVFGCAKRAIAGRRYGYRDRLQEAGITLAILLVLMWFALPSSYMDGAHQRGAREAVLKENLSRMREEVANFEQERHRHPDGLRELVREKYLRRIPFDPITRRTDSWIEIRDGDGMIDVRSSATGTTRDGIPYGRL